jgi:DNA-3-methyladenine glycosylase
VARIQAWNGSPVAAHPDVRLPRRFYDRPTLDVARDLIGKVLVHNRRGTLTSGIIVEVEAYIGESDPACHAAPGLTTRNAPLYGPPGYAYVYLNYGIHSLVNVVTESADAPAAVLIRALDPLEGISVMRRRRARSAKAMGITLAQNRADLCGDVLFIEAIEQEDAASRRDALVWSPRIGISVGTERPWRVYLDGHPSVSGRRPPRG